ncbi:MAG: penicillin-binding protein 2, partial [Acidimicrobiales bacterium]
TNIATQNVPITPTRGLIFGRAGQMMVSNKVEPVVTLSRQEAAANPAVVKRLSVVLALPIAQIQTTLADVQNSPYEPAPIAVNPPLSAIVYLSEHPDLFPGVTVSYVGERQYPYGDAAAQVLGYVSDINSSELSQLKKKGYSQGDVIGQSGVEASYERFLRGSTGTRALEVDALGDTVGTKHVTPPRSGDNVVLNLDVGLQQAAQADLASEISLLQSQGVPANSGGAVVVEDPRNGAILAMASNPTYDPSWWVGGISTKHYQYLSSTAAHIPLLNRATQGLYPPGSTFKLATATAALDSGLISPYTDINDPGAFTIPNCGGSLGCVFHNNESESCGSCNVVTAITISDDVFFYTLGYDFFTQPGRFGTEPIENTAHAYGLGVPSGIDIPGEYPGQVDGPALRKAQHKAAPKAFPYTFYGPGDAVNTAFGQGETVISPLELANAYATFANGGTRYAPEVGAAIESPSGRLLRRIAPRVLGHVPMSPANRAAIMQGLIGAATSTSPGDVGTASGTLTQMHYPYSKLPIAGKTGTSQVSSSVNSSPDAVFVAFGPTSSPRYVIAVIIPNGGYGATAAAPVAVKLFEYLIKHPVGPLNLKAPPGTA